MGRDNRRFRALVNVRIWGGPGGLCSLRRGQARFSLAVLRSRRSRRHLRRRFSKFGRRGEQSPPRSSRRISRSTWRGLQTARLVLASGFRHRQGQTGQQVEHSSQMFSFAGFAAFAAFAKTPRPRNSVAQMDHGGDPERGGVGFLVVITLVSCVSSRLCRTFRAVFSNSSLRGHSNREPSQPNGMKPSTNNRLPRSFCEFPIIQRNSFFHTSDLFHLKAQGTSTL